MFYDRLTSLFFEHASYFRAMTIDEYEFMFINYSFHEKEFDRICLWWNKATLKIDLRSMVYTAEIFQTMAAFGFDEAKYSGWELGMED